MALPGRTVTCDVSTSTWPEGAVAACQADSGYAMTLRTSASPAVQIRMCSSAACLSTITAIKQANPAECDTGYTWLYANIITPIETTCRSIAAPTPTILVPPPSSTQTPSTPKTPTPKTPTPSVQPSPTTTTTPMTPTPEMTSAPGDSPTNSPQQSTGSSSSPAPDAPDAPPTTPPSDVTPDSSSSSSSSSSPSTLVVSAPPGAWPASSSEGPNNVNHALTDPRSGTSQPVEPIDNEALKSDTRRPSNTIAVVLGCAVGAMIVLVVLWVVVQRRRRRVALKSQAGLQYHTLMDTTKTTGSSSHHKSTSFSQEELHALLEPLKYRRINLDDVTDTELIGSGTQGVVFLVKLHNKSLVSKRILAAQFTVQKLISLVTEVELLVTLQHPSIVRFVGVAWSTPLDFQALFEHMANGDLRSFLDRTATGPPSERPPWTQEKLRITLRVAEGLAYIHSFSPPIMHRDLKARNILLDAKMRAKISDFGVSRLQSEHGTMTTGVGTSRWLAPEVIMGGGAYTEQCDVYSFGQVLVEMDTHALPFAHVKVAEVALMQRVLKGDSLGLLQISESCPAEIAQLMTRCLSVDPTQRPNALALAFELRRLVKQNGG